jgi:hypothetical protein
MLLLTLDLLLELPDLSEQPVDLELLFVLQLLVKLTKTGGPVVVWRSACNQAGGSGYRTRNASLIAVCRALRDHLAGRWHRGVGHLEVHEDLGTAATGAR